MAALAGAEELRLTRSLYPPDAGRGPPGRRLVLREAEPPWPQTPPRDECERQPGRWAELRAARDPVPVIFEGTGGMASWHRALGQHVERELRARPADCWHFDPELPLGLILGGFPKWDRHGRRRDTGETCEEFASLVLDYEAELSRERCSPRCSASPSSRNTTGKRSAWPGTWPIRTPAGRAGPTTRCATAVTDRLPPGGAGCGPCPRTSWDRDARCTRWP
jgi:hypothetical protein